MKHTKEGFKAAAKARLKAAEILMENEDWDMAGYLLGYVLECALKSVVCKNLRLTKYPAGDKDKGEKDYFWTHRFDRLLTISGMQDLFGVQSFVWSQFVQEYEGDWPAKFRYGTGVLEEIKVRQLHSHLTNKTTGSEGILTLISKNRRW